jgi:phage terminase large subunit-like protein
MDSKDAVETIIRLKQLYKFDIILIGKGALEKAIGPYLRDELYKRAVSPRGGNTRSYRQTQRAQSIRARMRAGGRQIRQAKALVLRTETELLQFDRGQHDDQVDMMSLFGLYLNKIQDAPTLKEISTRVV